MLIRIGHAVAFNTACCVIAICDGWPLLLDFVRELLRQALPESSLAELSRSRPYKFRGSRGLTLGVRGRFTLLSAPGMS